MAKNILDRYGVKEVADVTFYTINEEGKPDKPVLYLDTLKVSTIEQTAEYTSARGGKGNPELITWDYNKEITATLEDALFSVKSMAILYGAVDNEGNVVLDETTTELIKTVPYSQVEGSDKESLKTVVTGKEIKIPTDAVYYDAHNKPLEGDPTFGEGHNWEYVTFKIKGEEMTTIEISPATFPGTYYVTGDTFARRERDGVDEFFQFILPKAKITSEVTLTMEAEGDPSTFSMNLRVLRPADGKMMKLVKYNIDPATVTAAG